MNTASPSKVQSPNSSAITNIRRGTGLATLFVFLVATTVAWGQSNVYSINVVGYYNRLLSTGDNLVANQLTLGSANNTLNNVLINGVADGSTFTKWDPVANHFLPVSIFNAAQTNWSINYQLDLGQGGLLHSPVQALNTFVGGVDSTIYNIDTGVLTWNPNYAPGLYLISCPVPLTTETFDTVVGRAPRNGEWVNILNETTQTYSLTTYHDGTGWDNGDPVLSVGQAAWFDLGPVTVPEPSGLELLCAGALTLLAFRQRTPRQA